MQHDGDAWASNTSQIGNARVLLPRVYAQSPYQLFRKRWLQDQNALGRNIAAHERHAETRIVWDDMSAAKKKPWIEEATALK